MRILRELSGIMILWHGKTVASNKFLVCFDRDFQVKHVDKVQVATKNSKV